MKVLKNTKLLLIIFIPIFKMNTQITQMKISTFALLFLAIAYNATAQVAETKISSTIKEVIVYLNGSRIKRTAPITLKAGKNQLILNQLSTAIDESSIQVAGLKNSNVLSVNYEVDYLEKKSISETVKQLKSKKETLSFQKKKLENKLTAYDRELKVMDYNLRVNSDQTDLSLERLKQIGAFHRERINFILDHKLELQSAQSKLAKKITDLTQEIRKQEGNSKEAQGQIIVKLDAPMPTTINLEVSYNVAKSGWYPEYDLKSNSIQSDLSIVYKANVYQETGVSWKNVAITLSTGDPTLDNNKPNLDSKYLNFLPDFYRKKQASNSAVSRVSSEQLDEVVFKEAEIEDALEGRAAGVRVQKSKVFVRGLSSFPSSEEEKPYNETVGAKQEGITNTSFKIKKKYTIASNSETTVIEIDKFSLPTAYSYYVAPELNTNVFLTAILSNWEQFDLLTGEANIYFEGNYVGKALIESNSTKEKLVLSLGVDPNIIVARKTPKNFISKSFTGSTRIVKKAFEISVKNNKSQAIDLVIEERIPISNNKEIKVSDILTEGAQYDPKKGIAKWKVNIASKQSVKKNLSYTVKFPKGKRVNL